MPSEEKGPPSQRKAALEVTSLYLAIQGFDVAPRLRFHWGRWFLGETRIVYVHGRYASLGFPRDSHELNREEVRTRRRLE